MTDTQKRDIIGLLDTHYTHYRQDAETAGEDARRTELQLAFYRGLKTAAEMAGLQIRRTKVGKHHIIGED